MPTYIYKCNDCDFTFEAQQRFSDAPLTDCPHCNDGSVRRVINSVGIVFKGNGFYVTDNRNGKNGLVSSNGSSASNGTGEATTSEKSEGSEKKEAKQKKTESTTESS